MVAVAGTSRASARGIRHTAFRAVATAALALLAACAGPSAPDDGAAGVTDAKVAANTAAQPKVGAAVERSGLGLRPLTPQLAVAPGMTPRSSVSADLYDLTTSVIRELPWGDEISPGSDRPRAEMERGGASWYGIQFHQRKTASGERFNMSDMTAAHKTLPFNTRVCVRSLVTGREVVVRINDRGPYSAGRVIDLSRAAADAIGMLDLGIKPVALSVLEKGQRCGGVALNVADGDPVPEPATVRPKRRTRAAVNPRRRR